MIAVGPCERLPAFLAVVVSLLVAVGCSDPPAAVEPLEGRLVVHLQEGQAWEASGPAVEANLVCGEGQRRWLGTEDLVGNDLADSEAMRMMKEAEATRVDPPLVFLDEWICTDGRGAFTSASRPDADSWDIVSGRGSLIELSGSGTISFGETLEAIPEALYLTGALTPAAQQG